jgi:hypothetical protein
MLSDVRFRVALSFPGEQRSLVSEVADGLAEVLGRDQVFYDEFHPADLAVQDLDLVVQRIYRNRSDLIVIFLCADYDRKEWCRLEWRAVRDVLKAKRSEQILLIRMDDAEVPGVLSIDGYLDGRKYSPAELTSFILQRLDRLALSPIRLNSPHAGR